MFVPVLEQTAADWAATESVAVGGIVTARETLPEVTLEQASLETTTL
jgi:hypothetical protein